MRKEVFVLLAVFIAVTSLSSAFGGVATARSQRARSTWYWTPGACKSGLQKYGMQISDGRTFNVQAAFCIGKGGRTTCAWNSSYSARLYSQFAVLTRSYDGTIRGFQMHPTGRIGYSATNLRAFGNESLAAFYRYAGDLAHAAAVAAQNAGCGPPLNG